MTLLSGLCLLSLIVVLVRTVHVISSIDIHRYTGHWIRFAALGVYWSLLCAGAVAVTVGQPIGGPMLLIAIALLKISDRRRT